MKKGPGQDNIIQLQKRMKDLQNVLMVEKNQSMKRYVKRREGNTYLYFIQVHKNLWTDLQEIGSLGPVYVQGGRN